MSDYSFDTDTEDEAEPLTPEEGLSDTIIRKGAAMAATGSTRPAVQKALKLSLYMVKKLYKHELFRTTLAEISDDAVAAAKVKTRNDISRMQTKAMAALEKNLDKHSLEAVKIFLKSMGLAEETENKDGGGFTLMLATQPKPTNTITVKREGEE